MRFLFSVCFIVMCGFVSKAQPAINNWYSFSHDQSLMNSVVVTDSCYYATAIVASNITSGVAHFVFVKYDFGGNVINQTILHSDTNWVHNGWVDLTPTYDTNFVCVFDYDEYFMFAKISPDGDTIFTSFIKEFYDNHGHEAIHPVAILENLSDTTYTGLVCIQNTIDLGSYIGLFNVDQNGNLNFYKLYSISQPGYTITYPRSLIKEPDGYLISCDIIKDVSGYADDSQRVRLIKTDNSGTEQWRWTDMDHANDVFPFGLTKTPDDGYLYGGITGWFNTYYNGHFYLGHIVKLDSNLNQDWEIKMGDSTGLDYIRFSEILELENNRYVATGYCTKDTMTIGWLVNFDITGQVHWDSYFSYVPGSTATYNPWHELYDVELTLDKGFVMVGNAWDQDATSAGNPGSFAWLVKTDSVGCLVPGCQDFFGVDENATPQIKLSIYPNPTADILNIYFYNSTFNGNETIQVFDMQGKLMREWPVHTNDITFMYDVSMLPAGAYILKVVANDIEKSVQKFMVE